MSAGGDWEEPELTLGELLAAELKERSEPTAGERAAGGLPCPWCGTAADVSEETSGTMSLNPTKRWWSVACPNMDCAVVITTNAFHPTHEAAIAAWNTRAELPSIPRELVTDAEAIVMAQRVLRDTSVRDGACAQCFPGDAHALSVGFVCAMHIAVRVLGARAALGGEG